MMAWYDNTYNENATPESLPGYSASQTLPGATFNPIDQGVPGATVGPAGGDTITTLPDASQYSQTLAAMLALPGNLLLNMKLAVAAAHNNAQASANETSRTLSGFNPLALRQATQQHVAGLHPPSAAPLVNTVKAQHMAGFVAASLTWADDALIAALQSAASSAGPQAALMASTVQGDSKSVSAGGGTAVGRRGTPASSLIYLSQGSGPAKQGHHNTQWFFPTIHTWAATNPPPPAQERSLTPSPSSDGQLPMEGAP